MRSLVRHITVIMLVATCTVTSHAQEEELKYYRLSIGVSAGDILHHLFNSSDTNRSYAAFVLEYSGHKYALQAGFRPGYNASDTQHEGFVDGEVTDEKKLSGHLALTRSLLSDKRWLVRAGLRYEGGYSREDIIEDSGFDRITTRRLQWNGGGGPILDFRYFVHPRISLGMDAGLIYSYSESEHQQLFTNFPDFDNTKEKIIEKKLLVAEPMTIYMRFHL